jgi:hypothetical protein
MSRSIYICYFGFRTLVLTQSLTTHSFWLTTARLVLAWASGHLATLKALIPAIFSQYFTPLCLKFVLTYRQSIKPINQMIYSLKCDKFEKITTTTLNAIQKRQSARHGAFTRSHHPTHSQPDDCC